VNVSFAQNIIITPVVFFTGEKAYEGSVDANADCIGIEITNTATKTEITINCELFTMCNFFKINFEYNKNGSFEKCTNDFSI